MASRGVSTARRPTASSPTRPPCMSPSSSTARACCARRGARSRCGTSTSCPRCWPPSLWQSPTASPNQASRPRPADPLGPDDAPKRLIALDAEVHGVDTRREAGGRLGALALCEGIVRRRPGMPLALVQLSLLRRETGDLAGAVRNAEEALRLAPEDP